LSGGVRQREWIESAKGDQARLEFYVRTGNTEDPGKEWSKWFGPYSKPGTPMEARAARFVQWKAVIHDGGRATESIG